MNRIHTKKYPSTMKITMLYHFTHISHYNKGFDICNVSWLKTAQQRNTISTLIYYAMSNVVDDEVAEERALHRIE